MYEERTFIPPPPDSFLRKIFPYWGIILIKILEVEGEWECSLEEEEEQEGRRGIFVLVIVLKMSKLQPPEEA